MHLMVIMVACALVVGWRWAAGTTPSTTLRHTRMIRASLVSVIIGAVTTAITGTDWALVAIAVSYVMGWLTHWIVYPDGVNMGTLTDELARDDVELFKRYKQDQDQPSHHVHIV